MDKDGGDAAADYFTKESFATDSAKKALFDFIERDIAVAGKLANFVDDDDPQVCLNDRLHTVGEDGFVDIGVIPFETSVPPTTSMPDSRAGTDYCLGTLVGDDDAIPTPSEYMEYSSKASRKKFCARPKANSEDANALGP